MKKLLLVTFLGALALLGALRFWFPSAVSNREMVRTRIDLMGTFWEFQVPVGSVSEKERATATTKTAIEELKRIDRLMSEWKSESPLSQINRRAGEWVTVPRELIELLERSIGYSRTTDGAFDVTWRGLGSLWTLDETFQPPSPAEIEAALRHVGWEEIDIRGSSVRIPRDFSLGLGGIAKGYAIDQAGGVLRRAGFSDFLVNGGGDVLTAGSKWGALWSVGIRDPRKEPGQLLCRLDFRDGAVVTSGDYERFVLHEGIRYHHILDPRTGRPARECRSVTVLAETAEEADVLATAVFVLGAARGLTLARERGFETLIVDSEGTLHMTAGFRSRARFQDPRSARSDE